MRVVIGSLVFSFLGLILQGSVLPAIIPTYAIPNFLLTLVVYLGFYEVSVLGVLLTFGIGLLFDLFSGTLLGPWAGAFVFIFVMLSVFAQRLFVHSTPTIILSVFISSLISNLLYVGLLYQFQPVPPGLLQTSLFESLISSICAPFCFYLFRIMRSVSAEKLTVSRRAPNLFSMARNER